MSNVKQVIVIRRDLKMRRGKEIAQGAHASQAWLLRRLEDQGHGHFTLEPSKEEVEWMNSGHTKVTCQATSEAELAALFAAARLAGLNAELITDAGRTEFDGVPTVTCLAVGPNRTEDVDKITGHLTLY